ncbi:MAG TPA: rhodanese-like domain-containing protein, partial [Methanomicrobiales archaeon]|nr:rhodanese-like domain-containing protein [Methanomicrobiales archaeon]
NINCHDKELLSREIAGLDKDCTYILYCRRGIRAPQVLQYMVDRGFPKVCSIMGGIQNWQAQGMPVVREEAFE